MDLYLPDDFYALRDEREEAERRYDAPATHSMDASLWLGAEALVAPAVTRDTTERTRGARRMQAIDDPSWSVV